MGKEKVPVEDLEEGMVLAENVVNNHGTLLISAGAFIYSELIEKLERLGISSVNIYRNDGEINNDSNQKINKMQYQ